MGEVIEFGYNAQVSQIILDKAGAARDMNQLSVYQGYISKYVGGLFN